MNENTTSARTRAEPGQTANTDAATSAAGADLAALFSALSHDLRAALNGIIVWTHILERNGDDTTLRAVEGIRRAVTQQSQLAMELSEFGRAIVADGWPDGLTAAQAIGDAVEQAGDGAAVELDLPNELPRPAMPAIALQAIVRLLVQSARAHTDSDGRVQLNVARDHDALCLRLRLIRADGAPANNATNARRSLRESLAALCADLFDGAALVEGDVIGVRLKLR